MKIEESLTLEHVSTIRSKQGREVVGLLIGRLGDNLPGSTILIFPDLDCPENPFGWYLDGTPKHDEHGKYTECSTVGALDYRKGTVIKVELDYEDTPKAKRLRILSVEGVAFLAEYEGVVPKWLG